MQTYIDQRPAFSALGNQAPDAYFQQLPTPCYVISEARLEANARILAEVSKHTGAKILLAQKAFSNYNFYPILAPYLAGTEASGLYEARLGREEMPSKEVHVFCAAYRDDEMKELVQYADHIVFNSPAQLKKYGPMLKAAGKSLGLRVNPEHSTQEGHDIYDPCAPGSRLGTTREVWNAEMNEESISLLDGLHFHTLCEQDSDALEETYEAFVQGFGDILPRMKWLNMGGGHHITRPDYDISRLERILIKASKDWELQIYLEPGEAVALNAGYAISEVLDIVHNNGRSIAILDISAACHMPDVIEMPYLPPVYGALEEGSGHEYILGGPTCLSGDIIGSYRFPGPLEIGDKLVFGDLAIYSTCKNNTFNGMPLPNIWRETKAGSFEKLTDFGYQDFKHRLGTT